jgi:hypothetical protein
MQRHRFLEHIPAPPATSVGVPNGFMVFSLPVASLAQAPWQQLYQLAYEQARAVVAPSRLERLQAALPN